MHYEIFSGSFHGVLLMYLIPWLLLFPYRLASSFVCLWRVVLSVEALWKQCMQMLLIVYCNGHLKYMIGHLHSFVFVSFSKAMNLISSRRMKLRSHYDFLKGMHVFLTDLIQSKGRCYFTRPKQKSGTCSCWKTKHYSMQLCMTECLQFWPQIVILVTLNAMQNRL